MRIKKISILYSGIVFSLLLSLVLLLISYFYLPLGDNKNLSFIIPKNATALQIKALLKQQGVSTYMCYLFVLTKYMSLSHPILAGEYQIEHTATLSQLMEKLRKGKITLHRITIPEGWTFEQLRSALAAQPQLQHTIQAQDTGAHIMASIQHTGENPEGRFYPDTYLFALDTPDTKILKLAYDLMQLKLQKIWRSRTSNLPYSTPYAALIVASLIEKETKIASERAKVAGVIQRRLEKKMRLQIDASVLYGLSKKNRHLSYQDLKKDGPYNTYTRYGLPPTPIAMPGELAIIAALHPNKDSSLFYVAKGDGSHVFSDTFAEHKTAVKAYLCFKVKCVTVSP